MPELLEREFAPLAEITTGLRERQDQERRARRDLRAQIIRMERQLGELFASAFPRRGIGFEVAAPEGPRVLGIEELEKVRDALALRLQVVRGELGGRAKVEEMNRE